MTPRKLSVGPIAVARATAATRFGTKAIAPTIIPSRPISPSSIRPRRLNRLTDPAPTTPIKAPDSRGPDQGAEGAGPSQARLGEDGSTDVQRSHHGQVGTEQDQ